MTKFFKLLHNVPVTLIALEDFNDLELVEDSYNGEVNMKYRLPVSIGDDKSGKYKANGKGDKYAEKLLLDFADSMFDKYVAPLGILSGEWFEIEIVKDGKYNAYRIQVLGRTESGNPPPSATPEKTRTAPVPAMPAPSASSTQNAQNASKAQPDESYVDYCCDVMLSVVRKLEPIKEKVGENFSAVCNTVFIQSVKR